MKYGAVRKFSRVTGYSVVIREINPKWKILMDLKSLVVSLKYVISVLHASCLKVAFWQPNQTFNFAGGTVKCSPLN